MDMSKGMPDCAAMMQMQKQMATDQKADDARLNDLVTKMNQCSPDQKMDAMAAVISELVTQRARSREMDETMQDQMMMHMMQHMQHGGAASAMQCPMMKAMAPQKGATTSFPKGISPHHEPEPQE
jgi:hypothetical protein